MRSHLRKRSLLRVPGRLPLNAEQAAGIMTELGASEAYVYAMGEESWLGHIMATSYNEDSYQLKQVDQFMTWCAEHGIKSDHLFGQHEWRW